MLCAFGTWAASHPSPSSVRRNLDATGRIHAALVPIQHTAMNNLSEQATATILVVDDDDGVRNVLARWVAEMGHSVLSAADADSALDAMRERPVDVALCDIRMPGRDGIWLIEQIGRLFPGVAIVVATGLVEMDPMITLRPGVIGYIVKPFNREELAAVVKRGITERARLQRNSRSGPRLLDAGLMDDLVVSPD